MSDSVLHRAMAFASTAHSGADREGDFPLPYITHPVEVLQNLRYTGEVTDSDLLCTALLHDVIEESPVKLSQIEAEFGSRVAGLVLELTRKEPTACEITGMNKAEIWSLRAEMLLGEIAEMSVEAQTVKLADRLSNIREAKRTKKDEKLKRYLGQTKKMLEIVPRTVNPGLWDAIKREV